MAYLPQRRSAPIAMNSIKDQVDKFYAYKGTNGYGDAMKFKGVVEKKGYCFTVDDDLKLPPDYIEYMIRKIEWYNRKAVITLHGKILRQWPVSSFYDSVFHKFRCTDEVRKDVPVHIPGTGVMGWHSDTITFSMDDFPEKNMADIWAGIKCERENVPRICVAHSSAWIHGLPSEGKDCWTMNKERDHLLTDAINSIQWSEI